jgi:hypothetical protein
MHICVLQIHWDKAQNHWRDKLMSNGKNRLQTIHALFSLLLSISLIWPRLPICLYQLFISSDTCTFPLHPQKKLEELMELLGWEDIWANPKDTTQLHLKLNMCHVWNRKQAMLVASLGPWFLSNQNGISYLSIWNPKNLRSTHKIC